MYGYVGNRPLVAVDPDGLDGEEPTAQDCIADPESCEAGGGGFGGVS